MSQYIPQMQMPQMQMPQMGNPLQYRMPQMGNMQIGGGGSADYFARGQQMLANAGQTMGQMGQAKDETRTVTNEPGPMGFMDYLDAGVGYGLAGMKAYDMYQDWQGGKTAKDAANLLNSPSGGSAIGAAPRVLTGQAGAAGIGGASATAMGGRGAKEMLRGGVDTATGTSTAGASQQVASGLFGKALGVGGLALGGLQGMQMGAAHREAGGKSLGGAIGSGIMPAIGGGLMMGGPLGAVIGGGVGILGYLLG